MALRPVLDFSGNGGVAEQIQADSAETAESPRVSKTPELWIHSVTVVPGWLTLETTDLRACVNLHLAKNP